MSTVVTAPSITTTGLGTTISELGSSVANLGSNVLKIGGVAATAIFTSQSLGGGTDFIPAPQVIPDLDANRQPIAMGSKTKVKNQSKVDEKDITCTADNPNCKENHLHRGVIQAQEAKGMLVIVPAGHNWFTKHPPSFARVTGSLTIVRAALEAQRPKVSSNSTLKLIGGDRGNSFQANADLAAANLLRYLEKNKTNGISAVVNRSFYFNGSQGNGRRGPTSGPESRRIDIDIELGSIMGNKSI